MKKLLYVFLVIVSILLTVYACTDLLWGGMCANEIIDEVPSPGKAFKAVIFTRDCGATTGSSTQVAIVEYSDNLDDEGGNVLIMSDRPGDGLRNRNGGAKVEATWTTDTTITIYLDKRSGSIKHGNEINGIKINYEQIAD